MQDEVPASQDIEGDSLEAEVEQSRDRRNTEMYAYPNMMSGPVGPDSPAMPASDGSDVPDSDMPASDMSDDLDMLVSDMADDLDVLASDMSEEQTYNPDIDLGQNFEAKGSYSLDLVGQRRLVRYARSIVDHLQLPEAMESSLLAYINHSE